MMNGIVALQSLPMRKDDAKKNGRLFCSAGCVGSRRTIKLFTLKFKHVGAKDYPAVLLRSNRSLLMLLRRCFSFSSLWTGALVDTGREQAKRVVRNGKKFAKKHVKKFSISGDQKTMKFKRVQESARKDIERAFGVLQGRWGIIQQPARSYHMNTIKRIMYRCMISHNMILEDQKFDISEYWHMYASPESNIQRTWVERCERQRRRNKELRDRRVHKDLQHDIVEHLWHLNNEI
ncbi:ALP1-like protein isoform X1 [Tanacetum coccineum]|uniref:ALP1-like protein isoform X1 n=1 Tax=Tanacetum coccineum TaxID=301880 RepID=A0ABQ5AJH5_9ASTR